MKLILAFFLLASCILPGGVSPARAATEGIAATVNDDAVTVSDLEDRMRLILVSSGMPQTPEMRARVRPQVLDTLIEERLRLQEAGRLSIAVPPEDIEKGLATVAGQNNMDAARFKAMLAASGINVRTLRDQIESQLAWTQVIQKKLRPQVTIGEADIDERMARLQNAIGKTEYLLAEIFLPVEQTKDDAPARQLAQRLVGEMRTRGAPFPAVARQFSRAPGASRGGDMGWVQQGQLAEGLEKAVAQLEKGRITDPVRAPNGYHIILLREKRNITKDTLPSRDKVLNQIGIEALERLQRRFMLDLRSAAFIETRV